MAETTLQLGFVPKERGNYTSGTNYYKDNVVQYNGSSYIADPVGWSESEPTATYVTVPPTDASGNLNAGWKVFASGNNTFTTGEKVDNVGIDNEPTAGSKNLVESGGVEKNFRYLNGSISGKEEIDFSISDINGHDIVQFKNGGIKTKNFNSENYENIDNTPQSFSDIDFSIGDGNGYDIVQFKGGHIKTKNFDSSLPIETEDLKPLLLHIVVTGQSLSVGYNSSPVLSKVNSKRTFMFKHVRSFDFGYIYNITKATYNASQDSYDNDFYQLSPLVEQSKYGTSSSAWTDTLANNEYETPCSGIAEGILKAYQNLGYSDIPYYVLCSCSGVGGVGISSIQSGTDIFERTKKDIQYGMKAANEKGVAYLPVIVWIQGEHDSTSMSVSQYKVALTQFHTDIASFCLKLGINRIPVFSYQTSLPHSTDIDARGGSVALAQMELDSEEWFHMAYPTYALQHNASDHVHLTNIGSRLLGNMIGDAITKNIDGYWETLKITGAFVDGTNVTVVFNKAIVVDNDHILDTDAWTSEQNTWRENSMGFCAVDDNNNDLLTTITKISDTSLLITCSAAPTKITYGIYPPPIGCPLGGTIREKESILGYDNEETYRYMPTQIVNVEARHEF